jgi:flagellar basal-body rod modification protein FlgD
MASTSATTASPVVSGTTTATSSSSSSSSASSTNALASQQIAGNFQSFLQLLTTQLQNQNPLSPLDTNQFTQQLVEFAGVQEQLNTNDSLSTLVSLQQTAAATQALDFVGKTAIVSGSTAAMTNSSATWELNVPANANVNVTITNSSGQTVYSGVVPMNSGQQPFTWNGQSSDGTQWPDGQYTMTASYSNGSGSTVAIPTQIAGTISGVNLSQSPPLLIINGQSYTVSQVQTISNPSSSSGS